MIFSKAPPKQRVLTLQLTNDRFAIPPGADNYRVEAHGTLPNDATLLSFFPHMHVRGKRFEGKAMFIPTAPSSLYWPSATISIGS